MKVKEQGLYIHIPFCKSKCSYCDFYRIVNLSQMDKYIDAAIIEMNEWKDKLDNLTTIYVGGGTPSVLGEKLLDILLSSVHRIFDLKKIEEFTVECNPEDIDDKIVDVLVKNGVNRVSLGVQSLNNNMLKFLNRRHDAKKVYDSIDFIRQKGIDNISVDLIFGYPKIDNYDFKEDVDKFMKLRIEHLSAYALSYEEGAWLTKLVESGKVKPIDDDEVADQYKYLCETMKENEYVHYEISNYCREDKYSRHNKACWNRQEYIGIGPGASSFIDGKRWTNVQDVAKYISNIETSEVEKEEEILNEDDVYNEIVMLGLRTKDGVDIEKMNEVYKSIFINRAEELLKEKLLVNGNGWYKIPEDKWFLLDMITEKCMI